MQVYLKLQIDMQVGIGPDLSVDVDRDGDLDDGVDACLAVHDDVATPHTCADEAGVDYGTDAGAGHREGETELATQR